MESDSPTAQRLLTQAREVGQWYAGQSLAAGLCFEVLALHPDHREALELLRQFCHDEWLIYDNRIALQHHIEEWDDRPHQQRRRLAMSFRFMSQWSGWDREYAKSYKRERNGPPDVAKLLDEGRRQLLSAYCLGDEEATRYAWPQFTQAFEQTTDPRQALLWVGKLYADLGFFADAVEVLAELYSRYPELDYRRLLVEVKWWRDNAHRIPWLPPAGEGARYGRMMQHIDPNAPDHDTVIREFHAHATEKGFEQADWQPTIAPELADLVESALPAADTTPTESPVDWSFLDEDDGQPGDPPEWVHKMARMFRRRSKEEAQNGGENNDMADYILNDHRWTRTITPPATPKRYDPNDPPFDPAELLNEDELDLDFDEDEE